MLGLLFNMVVESVRKKKGTSGVESLRREYGFELKFLNQKQYDDESFLKLINAAMKVSGITSRENFERELARDIFKIIVDMFRGIIEHYPDAFSLLSNIEEIHGSIALIRDKKRIRVIERDADAKYVRLIYESPTKLDFFFDQFILETAKYYGESVKREYLSRMSEGAKSTLVSVWLS